MSVAVISAVALASATPGVVIALDARHQVHSLRVEVHRLRGKLTSLQGLVGYIMIKEPEEGRTNQSQELIPRSSDR